ncbi:ABC transporter ATP-binding protein [Xanthobacteraceae bacterium Astr-EGSB]|uniref:ABC transporter ATP-binding protein n=1 Tax=Astrobacterium formosum TaxID=3069710 RepID=UPI0027ADB5FA|nr:ABC transporter ATP-binding protein [Xanthobacteraceae bacterium Astr-EGSB]
MSDAAFIRLDGVSKGWGGSVGARELSLSVPQGAFLVLLGPSGCGKSTTLRLIAGLETPDAGRVLIDGRDVTHATPAERRLSMVFQSYALFPHLSVAENIVFGLEVRRVPRAERMERLERALELTGLAGYERRRPGELSGGQRQRVALARAVVADHPLCLMDEPLSNLDAKLRHSVRQDIRALQRRLGMTVVYVTHDQTEAMTMADIVVLMRDGRIEQAGTPAQLYKFPASVFAAGFVGSPPMSLLPGEALPRPPGLALDPGAVTLGLRPECVRVVAPERGMITGVVRESEFLGAETFMVAVTPGGSLLTARVPGDPGITAGVTVGLAWDWADLHVFDRATHRRLRGATVPAGGDVTSPVGATSSLEFFTSPAAE